MKKTLKIYNRSTSRVTEMAIDVIVKSQSKLETKFAYKHPFSGNMCELSVSTEVFKTMK